MARGGVGGKEGGLTNERPKTDHVILGPMRGIKNNLRCTYVRTFILTLQLLHQFREGEKNYDVDISP